MAEASVVEVASGAWRLNVQRAVIRMRSNPPKMGRRGSSVCQTCCQPPEIPLPISGMGASGYNRHDFEGYLGNVGQDDRVNAVPETNVDCTVADQNQYVGFGSCA